MLYSDISIEQHYPKTMTTEKCDGLMGDWKKLQHLISAVTG